MADQKYKKRIVLYLDILGFQNKVNESINNQKVFDSIHKALSNIYSDKFKNDNGPLKGTEYGTQISVFSDNIVYSEPYENKGSWFGFILSIYWLINEILWDGFLTRGAIVIGDLYHDEKIVFGPALNEAYRLESKVAIYPRVIFTKNTIEEGLKTSLYGDVNEDIKYLKQIVSEDEDGLFFINNLSKKHDFDDEETYIDLLFRAKKIIEEGLTNQDIKIKAKYEWLKRQYNALYDENIDARAPGKIYI